MQSDINFSPVVSGGASKISIAKYAEFGPTAVLVANIGQTFTHSRAEIAFRSPEFSSTPVAISPTGIQEEPAFVQQRPADPVAMDCLGGRASPVPKEIAWIFITRVGRVDVGQRN